ncbi:MAG: hypothetical protein M3458_04985 [Acidobacteriota bacterium]|nr:hypothetical protein [Acidobacteriota bacterium]
METPDEKIASLVGELPDPEGARHFYERLTAEHTRAVRLLARDPGLTADALALAAWSPLLATTLVQHPEYLSWLARERTQAGVKTVEELGESLARYAFTNSRLDPPTLVARFRRQTLLRTYLHDIRRTNTLVETTDELSNLADAVLQYALGLAQQELENLYGLPQHRDARGRSATAVFCVVALGKLGSRELNYASDIDLLFLYSHDGETSGTGERGAISNREYFAKLAERVARTVGHPAGEGAAYRVDLRLRPHGRDGALSTSLTEALRYYRETAQAWELQVLIRARAAAGSAALYAKFADGVRARVYRTDETVARALAHVRLAKQKIDRQHRVESGGFNVKLGRGGIREIEFIAQALQLAHGGRDPWLHAPHTLMSLGRLADRGLITERERTDLSNAYLFLRTLEHRLQMEHGLQTHTVPEDQQRRALVARRMSLTGVDALATFDAALRDQTARVRAAFQRVFGQAAGVEDSSTAAPRTPAASARRNTPINDTSVNDALINESIIDDVSINHATINEGGTSASTDLTDLADLTDLTDTSGLVDVAVASRGSLAAGSSAKVVVAAASEPRPVVHEPPADAETAAANTAATLLARRLAGGEEPSTGERLCGLLRRAAHETLNARRALALVARVAASLDKMSAPVELSEENLTPLVRLCGASEFFGEMLASNPALIPALLTPTPIVTARDHRALLRAAIDGEESFGGELSALRRGWAHMLIEIGACDVAGAITMREANRLQAGLAAASLNVAYLIAQRELARRFGQLAAEPRVAILGLGRLGSGGTDYGSDLDIVLVHDPVVPSPIAVLTREEAYARLAEIFVTALSSLTRDGYLYRVDLRLRPDGKNGAVTLSAPAFISYLRDRAEVWEWLAYVKLRAVAGDMELARLTEHDARRAIHGAAVCIEPQSLRIETRRVRERLERERTTTGAAAHAIDIKFGRGGMLDVYFAARYLQLRDNVPDDGENRSTPATMARLHAANSINTKDYAAFNEGYALLRTLDHGLRLLVGRSTRLPVAEDHPVLRDLARATGHASAAALTTDLAGHMDSIRAAYDNITKPPLRAHD